MAQFNSLLVTGESRFINPINGNARNGVYTVIGTQTASTSAWTGKIDVPALYDGLRIAYYLPYASTSTAVTLNLTLSTGTTTGAINCYYNSATRLTTHYAVGCVIFFTYYNAGSISISGTATTDNRWIAHADYNYYTDQNAMYIRYYNNVLAKTAITSNTLIVGDDTGYSTVASGITFNISYPLIWCNTSVASGSSNYANMYSQIYDRSAASIKSGYTSAANKAQYLIVTISGLTATVDSNIITDTLPNTADGKVYIYLGKLGAQSTGANYFLFEPVHPMFEYKNGGLQPYSVGAGTDENVKQSNNSDTTEYPLLFSSANVYSGTITGPAYKNSQLQYNPGDNELTLRKATSSTGHSPRLSVIDYVGNTPVEHVTLGSYSAFRSSNIDLETSQMMLFDSHITLDSDSSIDGQGRIDLAGDVSCNNITDYTTNATKATNDIVTQTGIYTVIGTQTASTNKFTGVLPLPALYDGLTINYYIPYAPTSSNATLNLTLADGTTTGEKNLYISTSRFTSHIGAGRTAVMTYWSAGSISISGTPTTDDRWVCDGYYDTNDVVTLRSQYPRVTAGVNGIKRNSLFTKTLDGTYTSFFSNTGGTGVTKTYDFTTYYDPRDIWYHQNSSDVAANTVTGNNTIDFQHSLCDLRYSVSGITSSASTSTLVANKPVYIMFDKNSENCGYYRLKDPVWTQTPSDPDAIYTLVAYAYDVYRCDLWVNNPVFILQNNVLVPYDFDQNVNPTALSNLATAGDNVVTLNNAASAPVSNIIIPFEAIQDYGTPSTSTPKTIHGVSEITVTSCGKNLCNQKFTAYSIIDADGSLPYNPNHKTTEFIKINPNTAVSVYSSNLNERYSGGTTASIRLGFYNKKKYLLSRTDGVSATSVSATSPADAVYLVVQCGGNATDVEIEYGTTATAYTPYKSSITNIPLGDTYYGGYVEFDYTNKSYNIFVNNLIVDMGDLTYTQYDSTKITVSKDVLQTVTGYNPKRENSANLLCSIFSSSDIQQTANGIRFTTNVTAANAPTTFAGQKIVFELADYIVIPITKKPVNSIQGFNYLYSSAIGSISCQYRLDTSAVTTVASMIEASSGTLSELTDVSISTPNTCDVLFYDGYSWRNTNAPSLKDSMGHTTITLDGDTGLITSENSPSSGGQVVTDVAIGGFTTGSGNYFKFSLPFSNTATSAAIISLDQSNSKLMLPSTVLQTNFIDLSNSTVSSITKDWITFEFKLNSTQVANAPGTILLVDFEFELY